MVSGTKVIKRKITGFFKPKDVPIIRQVVNDVHLIMTNASILVRAFYLSQFESKKDVMIIDKELISVACDVVQGKKKSSSRDNTRFVEAKLEKLQIHASKTNKPFSREIEQTKLQNKKNNKNSKKIDLHDQLLSLYNELFVDNNEDGLYVQSQFSLSHVLIYSIEQLVTAYKNNVILHFTKYPIRVIKCDLIKQGLKSKDASWIAKKVVSHMFYDNEQAFKEDDNQKLMVLFKKDIDIVSELIRKYVVLFPDKKTDDKPRCYDIASSHWVYLKKMVELNIMLETQFLDVDAKYRKLLNPLPFHSTFVPMHVRLDTSGLVQLLSTKESLNDFKRLYFLEHGIDLKITGKSDALSSFKKIFDREPNSNEEEGLFATSYWSHFTNLKICKQWKELEIEIEKQKKNRPYIKGKKPFKYENYVFNNSIVTDGTSLSFQVCHITLFGRKDYADSQKKKNKITNKAEEPTYDIEQLEDQLKGKKETSNDPGKKDLLALTDGFRTLCYTKGQRNQDTLLYTRRINTQKRRKKKGVEAYESTVMNQFSSKSCISTEFFKYVRARKKKEKTLSSFYQAPMFRQFKYLVHTKQRSSEDKFINRVQKTFSKKYEGEPKTCVTEKMVRNNEVKVNSRDDIVIIWGNWGKTSHPNKLKGCEPSQGIGLIRSFLRFFMIYIISEHLTSQTCPYCKEKRCMENPRLNGIVRHHLLRCSNDNCHSRWWNRNVLGAFNILEKVEQCTRVKKLRGSDFQVQYLE